MKNNDRCSLQAKPSDCYLKNINKTSISQKLRTRNLIVLLESQIKPKTVPQKKLILSHFLKSARLEAIQFRVFAIVYQYDSNATISTQYANIIKQPYHLLWIVQQRNHINTVKPRRFKQRPFEVQGSEIFHSQVRPLITAPPPLAR